MERLMRSNPKLTRQEKEMKTKPTRYQIESNVKTLRDPGSVLIVVYITIITLLLLLGNLATASAEEHSEKGDTITLDEVRRGELLIKDVESGKFVAAPLLNQNVEISISGMVANAKIKQNFENPSSEWVEAVYAFPLPDESAVKNLRMVIGERIIVGEIKEKNEARAVYEKAKSEGKKASLLAQKRPNIFTMAVANIPPHSKIEVEIAYLDMVRYKDSTFSLRFPMVIGPRYIPGRPLAKEGRHHISFDGGGWASDTDQVEDASQITPPVAGPGEPLRNPVELSISLAPGFPVKGLNSLYHGVKVEEKMAGSYMLNFDGKVFADRDFVLEYQAANGKEIAAALFTEEVGEGDYKFLMLMPPVEKIENTLPREVIFVLDISGSMAGTSIVQAKSALQLAISRLHDRDRFNVIVFNNNARHLFPASLSASEENKDMAMEKVASIEADGGTEIGPALKLALDGRRDHQRIRQVVFLTDGSVGNERSLFTMIAKRLGDSRLFTVGIGSAPNSYFMTRAAAMGRGTFSYIGKIEEVNATMTQLFEKLENPVLSGMQLEVDDDVVIEMYPSPLPDLYMGEPVIALIRSDKPIAELRLTGYRMGKPWSVDIDTGSGKNRPGITTLWARKKIRSLMDAMNLGAAEPEVRRQVLATALEHHLVSRYTSLVAVEQQVSRPPMEKLETQQMKTNLPQGWKHNKVFGTSARTATASQLLSITGLILMFLSLLLLRTGRRRML